MPANTGVVAVITLALPLVSLAGAGEWRKDKARGFSREVERSRMRPLCDRLMGEVREYRSWVNVMSSLRTSLWYFLRSNLSERSRDARRSFSRSRESALIIQKYNWLFQVSIQILCSD